jgi:hypothetical protein
MRVEKWIERNMGPQKSGGSGIFTILANGNFANAEHEAIVALFSTRELAEAYVTASRLLESREERSYYRSFRRDSLLWNFNDSSAANYGSVTIREMPDVVPPFIAAGLHDLPVDPTSPVGPETSEPEYPHHVGVTVRDKYWRSGSG